MTSRAPTFILAPLLALFLLALTTTGALGRTMVSIDDSPDPVGPRIGYDVSYPNCTDHLPYDNAFRIVGVTGGRVFRPNPCLGAGGTGPAQLAWAGIGAELYMNTGNPGPGVTNWPAGQRSPRACGVGSHPRLDTLACAYDYGWNAAADAYATAVDAYVSLGWASAHATRTPAANRWWLDVETANSWRSDPELNVAALQGSADYLESMDVASVGFYSVDRMWYRITRGTDAFTDYPAWVAGAHTLEGAQLRCELPAFTGGRVAMTQYFANGFDADYRC